MKLLLIMPRYVFDRNLTNKATFDYTPSMGLAYISAVLKKNNYSVDCINFNHMDGKIEDIITNVLDKNKYDFICTGGNALGYSVLKKIIDSIKIHESKPIIILGGPIITTEPEIIFNDLNPDYGVIGEGETTILELVDYLQKGKDLNKVNGIIYKDKKNNTIITEKREAIKDLDSLPFPDFESFGFEEQLNNMHSNYVYAVNSFDHPRLYFLLGSRSCPFQCTFCYHDTQYRKRSIKNIINEIETVVKKYKINLLFIFDECFALERDRLDNFCERMNKLRKEISWDLKWNCQMSPRVVEKDILKIMRDAGCDSISYGFESYSPDVLKSMKKPITPEQINNALKWTLELNIGLQAYFIFGDVAETKETAKVTLDYWKKICNGQVGLSFIQPYPGSEIYKYCIKKGIIKDKLNFIKNVLNAYLWLNMTEKMNDLEIKQLKKDILDCQSKYVSYATPSSIKKEKENTFEVKVKCPFCEEEIIYKNFLIKNKFSFGTFIVCRNCHMRFFIVSSLQKIAYKYYPYTRILRDNYLNIRNYFKKKVVV